MKKEKNYKRDCKEFKRTTIITTPKIFDLLKKSPDTVLEEVSDIDPKEAFVIGYWIRDLLSSRSEDIEIIEK